MEKKYLECSERLGCFLEALMKSLFWIPPVLCSSAQGLPHSLFSRCLFSFFRLLSIGTIHWDREKVPVTELINIRVTRQRLAPSQLPFFMPLPLTLFCRLAFRVYRYMKRLKDIEDCAQGCMVEIIFCCKNGSIFFYYTFLWSRLYNAFILFYSLWI